MTEYMASSDEVGRRPRISLIRAYSSSFRPSSAHGCDSSGVCAAFPTVSATAATLPVLGPDGPDSPIMALGPVEEEPRHHRGDHRRRCQPDATTAVVEQAAQNGNHEC